MCFLQTFASNRSSEFRKKCRSVLSTAERARKDAISHSRLRPPNIVMDYAVMWPFQEFSKHTAQLLGELKGGEYSNRKFLFFFNDRVILRHAFFLLKSVFFEIR